MGKSLKITTLAAVFFALLLLCAYPLSWARVFAYGDIIRNWSLLEGFTWEIIGYFALGMIALKYQKMYQCLKKNPLLAAGSVIYIIVLILQQILIFKSPYFFGGGLAYPAMIAVGYLYADEWRKLLLPMMWLFFLFSLLCNLHDVIKNAIPGGFTGNWNWSAALLLTSSGSIFFLFSKKLPSFKYKWGIYFALYSIAILIYIYFVCRFPKGAYLGAFVGFAALLWGYLDNFTSRRTRVYGLLAILALIVAGTVVFRTQITSFMSKDTRIYLWENGLNVIKSNPLTGCEYGRYITESADKMAPEYFMTDMAAVIHNHPHNEFLFLLANSGIAGLFIIALMLYTFVKSILLFERKRDFEHGYFLFVYSALLAHSMVDVLLMHWPNGAIFYLLCGALIPMFKDEPEIETAEKYPYIKFLAAGAAVILGSYLFYMNFMSSMHLRNAVNLGQKYQQRLQETLKSIKYRPTYKNINDAAVLTPDINLAAAYLANMGNITGISNFSHSNFILASLYMQQGKINEALCFFQKEYDCFPLSVRNLYCYQLALQKAGRKDEALVIRRAITEILKIKGLENRHLMILVKNQEYDLNSGRIPAKLLNNTTKRNNQHQ